MILAWCGYAITGILTGLIAGILGVGGGIVVVPALLFIFEHVSAIPPAYEMQIAAGTSMAIMILTSQAAVRVHQRVQGLIWSDFLPLWPGILFGTVCGVLMASLVPTGGLRTILGICLLLIALDMIFNWSVPVARNVSLWVNRIITWSIGFTSGLLGIGGGVLVVPYLSYCGVQRRQIASTSALCTLMISVVGTAACIIVGATALGWSRMRLGFVYLPAVIGVAIPSMLFAAIGARLNYLLPVYYLRYLFIGVLLLASWGLLT